MKNEKFDRLLSEIRNEQVDDQVVAQAGERVWKSITGTDPAADLSTHTLAKLRRFSGADPGISGKAARAGARLAV